MVRQLRVFLCGAVAMGQGGDYQSYMDYQKYMPQGSGKSDKSGSSQGGDYQQYMDYSKYMPQGSGKGGGKGGDYQQYMDYQKYMPGGGKGSSSGGSQGADYTQYMSSGSGQGGGGKGGDYQKYYSKYMSQKSDKQDDANLNLIATDSKTDSGDDYKKYYQHYMPDVKNWSNREGVQDAFVHRYAGSYSDYVKQNANSTDANINLNAMDSKSNSKYYSKYMPDVKNWSNRDEVNDAFVSKYAGSYAKKEETASASIAKDDAVEALDPTSPNLASPAAVELASLPSAEGDNRLRVLLLIPLSLAAGGVAILYNKVQLRGRQQLDEPLL